MTFSTNRMLVLLTVMLCTLLFLVLLLYSMQKGPHDFPECLDCHPPGADGGITEKLLVAPNPSSAPDAINRSSTTIPIPSTSVRRTSPCPPTSPSRGTESSPA